MEAADDLVTLENALADYKSQGFDILINPSRQALPEFLKDLRPSAIALSPNENVAFELVTQTSANTYISKVEKLRAALNKQPNWSLKIVWRNIKPQPGLPLISKSRILAALTQAQSLVTNDQIIPGLLLGWSTFEAVGRVISPSALGRPQTPARLINILANAGHITPSEADKFRELAALRNRTVHGELDAPVSKIDVAEMLSVVSTLVANLLTDESH